MDGDSGDEGNDELTCVRSEDSDKSSFVICRQAKFLEKLIPETGRLLLTVNIPSFMFLKRPNILQLVFE